MANIKLKSLYIVLFIAFVSGLLLSVSFWYADTNNRTAEYGQINVQPVNSFDESQIDGAYTYNSMSVKGSNAAVSTNNKLPTMQAEQDDTIPDYEESLHWNDPEVSPEEMVAIKTLFEDMRKTATAEDWEGFIEQASLLSEHYVGLLAFSLMTVFQYNAPMEVVDKLVEMGVPLIHDYRVGPIIFEGDVERLNELVERGVSLTEPDIEGNNALHTATKLTAGTSSEHTHAVVELLLKHGIDVNVPNVDGFTALSNLIDISYTDDYLGTIKLLVDYGATVNESDRARLDIIRIEYPQYYKRLKTDVPTLFGDE